ncbi:MAG: glycoside hydrolase [Sphingomonadales bacterium]|nr:glycoside hydrolase [Sphingomonadales bacterium]
MTFKTVLLPLLLAATAAPALAGTPAADLEAQFRDPPMSARPRVWWHWMNGNITGDGIARDLAWMQAVGLGGVQNFDANLSTPQIVDHRLIYMTPEWKDAFRFAVSEADRRGLEFGIASSPGWSETGGPWVPPEDGLKKLVWSETLVAPGKTFHGALAAPPVVTGPFQSQAAAPDISAMMGGTKPAEPPRAHGDIAVLAVPVANAVVATPQLALGDGHPLDAARLGNPGIELPHGSAAAPTVVVLRYARPQTMRSLRFFLPGAKLMFGGASVAPVLEVADGAGWRKIADLPTTEVPTTVSFAPVTAASFRIVFTPLSTGGFDLGRGAPGVAPPFPVAALAGMGSAPLLLRELDLSGEARIDKAETKAGFAIALDYYAIPPVEDGATGAAAAQVIDLTARMAADGHLDWQAPRLPAGQQWRVMRLGWSLLGTTNHPATAEATGLEVDKFDRAAVTRYLDNYLKLYSDTVGADHIGKAGIRAFLTDSIEVGAANWTPRMIADFKELRGYDPTPWLPALAGVLIGSRAQSDAFLYDFRRTIADLMTSQHYETVDDFARAHGMRMYGEALEDHRPSLGDDMAMRHFTDVPMSAMWTYPQGGSPRPSYLADTKGASSVAHIWGQNFTAAESMTSAMTPWADSPRTLKHVIDQEFLQGINLPVIHESTHQPLDSKVPGLSLFIFGQYFNRLDAWAPLARPWIDYIARNALMLQQGVNVADVGYFYGEEAPLTGLYGDHPVTDAPRTHAYDFVNDDALMNVLANDGPDLVARGGARYKALYLGGSSYRMTLATLRRIAALAEGGATIVGLKPEGSPSLMGADAAGAAEYAALVAKLWPGGAVTNVGAGRVIASHDIEAALATIGVAPDFTFTGGSANADIPFVHRKLADGDDYFLVNRGAQTETIAAHFRATGKAPEVWHAEDGSAEPASYAIAGGETVVPLTLAPESAVHVVFRQPAAQAQRVIAEAAPVQRATLDGRWHVAFEPGRGAPAEATLAPLAPLNANAEPGIRYFSGIATYTHDFTTPAGWRPGHKLWLDLGEVRELARVTVNGTEVGTAWHAPFRLDIGAAARRGRNHLSVEVADLWVNRLIGDAQPGAKKITWTALPTYRADAPLRPSGLIGPVTLSN